MDIFPVIRVLVLLLVLVPLASAVLVPVLGRAARRASLTLALVHLGLTTAVVMMSIPLLDERDKSAKQLGSDGMIQQFEPEFVPGDTGTLKNSDGTDHRTHWTLLRLSATETSPHHPGEKVQFFLGIDGLNLWLVALASIMLVPAILISWESVQEKPGSFFGLLFLLQTGLVGCFLSFDVILFYVFFELTLIPAFFLIGRWGLGSGRRDAARKFFLYTLAGSLLTLIGVIGVVLTNPTPLHPATNTRVSDAVLPKEAAILPPGQATSEWVLAKPGSVTFSLPDLMSNVQVWANAHASAKDVLARAESQLAEERKSPKATESDPRVLAAKKRVESAQNLVTETEQMRAKNLRMQFWFFIALMAGFMVKVPIWPFHTWLPAAYGEAPTGITMILSAVMAKLGTFGILRLVIPLVPDAAVEYGLPAIGVLASIGIVYAAFCAFASKDIKQLIAYSSISHLGFLAIALFALNREALSGAVLHMVNHGLSTGAMFATLGFLLDRYRTTEMSKFSGLMARFPAFAVLTFVLSLASVGLPGLNNFVSEMMMMAGLFDADNPRVSGLWPAVVAAIGIFLSAWYTLTMLMRVFFNPLKEPEPSPITPRTHGDVSRREFFALGSLAALCLILGLYPQPVIDTMKADVRILSNISDGARARIRNAPFVSKEPYEPPPPIIPRENPAPTPRPDQKGPQVNDTDPKGDKTKGAKDKGNKAKKGAKKAGTAEE